MKKITFIFLFLLALGVSSSIACTNFLVTRGASADGSVMISYAADSHVLYGELYHRPAADWPAGTMVDVNEWDTGKYLGKIPQVAHTYSVIGNMNEYQVSIGETTYGGREELVNPSGIMDYGSLMYMSLQRSKTARQAIETIVSLCEQYGYYSSGESMSVADQNEVWIFEIIGKGPGQKGILYVARKVPDGYVCAHANQARIKTFPMNDPENCLYAKDVITFAREKGWFTGKDADFSFRDTYAPLNFSELRGCEARVYSFFNHVAKGMDQYIDYAMGFDSRKPMPLWIKPDRKLTAQDLMGYMGDHYEGTPMDMTKDLGAGAFECPYRWRPMNYEVDGQKYLNERAIATQQTGFSFIAQSRSWLPNPIGGIFWFGVDDAATTQYVPMYCGMLSVPKNFAEGNGDMLKYSETSAFWVFNRVSNMCYLRYNYMAKDVAKVQKELTDKFALYTPAIDKAAELLLAKDEELARQFLTDYSCQQADMTFNRWKELSEYLLVKYIDGNIKKEKDGKFLDNGTGVSLMPDQPGYSEAWKRMVKENAGERLKVVEMKK
ncbi:MAG: C69 family dipeptidase [Bacteroidales bacterium]|nr:C69 family dipeptidase [Bacteroidales bacterium]